MNCTNLTPHLGTNSAPDRNIRSGLYHTYRVRDGNRQFRRAPPVALLDRLLEIESAMGRTSKWPRNSPRIIDMDVWFHRE